MLLLIRTAISVKVRSLEQIDSQELKKSIILTLRMFLHETLHLV